MLEISLDLDVGLFVGCGCWNFVGIGFGLFRILDGWLLFVGLGSFFSRFGCLDFYWIWILFVADTKM
jgi:hypothetical protein